MPAAAEELLTVSQVAERLQLKESWVYSNADKLGAYRVGKYLRFRWDRVLERLEQTGPMEHVGSTTQRPPKHPAVRETSSGPRTSREQQHS